MKNEKKNRNERNKSKQKKKKKDTLEFIEEKGGKPQRYGHKGKIPKQNSNALCCKIKN